MPNVHKTQLLNELRARFGEFRQLAGSRSLLALGDDAARIYVRYSKVHRRGGPFFGLREVDLRQLEGHNAFLCLLLDDGSPPVFVPFADFEEVFRGAETAKDGQFKVHLFSRGDALELYVARQGRFNVEGYVGFDSLSRSLDARRLREAGDLSHSQVQTLLVGIGHIKGHDVYVPQADVAKLDWSLTTGFPLRGNIPVGFDRVANVLSEIDVLWIASGRDEIEGLFEVEHSTSIYSGLLRFNDVLLTDSKVSRFSIVSNDTRRSAFAQQLFRPTFRRSGLAERVSFLEYANVLHWHARLAKGECRSGMRPE
jgi:hypothetical protein